MKNLKYTIILVCIGYVSIVFSAYAGEHIFQPKIGIVDWSDNNNHRIKGNTFNLNNSSDLSSGFMYLYRLDNGFAFGGEHFTYNKDYTHTNSNTGDVDLTQAYVLAEFYFNNNGTIKPFIGVGLGFAFSDFNGAIEQKAYGSSSQLKAGVEFEINPRFSLSLEGKLFKVDIDEEINGENANVKSNGTGLFVGFSIKI